MEGIGVSKTCLERANERESPADARPLREGRQALRRAGRPARDRPRGRGGECLVLLGPSGCGKTTLLRLLAGLETVDAGRLWIGEREVTQLPPAERDVAMVFQNYALYPHLTVFENIAFPLRARQCRTGGDRPPRAQGGGAPRARAAPRSPAGPALGRAAAAGRRSRARSCAPRRLSDGRAALQPGRPAPRADAGRAQAPAAGAGHDHSLRHARPGRGHDAGTPRGPAAAARGRSSRWRRRSISTATRPRGSRPPFVGSPALNLWPATSGGTGRLKLLGTEMAVPEDVAAQATSLGRIEVGSTAGGQWPSPTVRVRSRRGPRSRDGADGERERC